VVMLDVLPRAEYADGLAPHDPRFKQVEHLFPRLVVHGREPGPGHLLAGGHELALDVSRAQRPQHRREGRALHHTERHAVGDKKVHDGRLDCARLRGGDAVQERGDACAWRMKSGQLR